MFHKTLIADLVVIGSALHLIANGRMQRVNPDLHVAGRGSPRAFAGNGKPMCSAADGALEKSHVQSEPFV